MLSDLLDVGMINVPWPAIINGKNYEGQLIKEHNYCKYKCLEFECKNIKSEDSVQICGLGLAYYQKRLKQHTVVVYGILPENKEIMKMSKQFKRDTKGRTVTKSQFIGWLKLLIEFFEVVRKTERKMLEEALHPLHETIKWSRQIHLLVGKILSKYGRSSIKDNYTMSSNEEKALYKASVMLTDTFETVAIYFNPDSATYGRKKKIDVYKLLDKMRIIHNLTSNKSINISGHSNRDYELYESFKLVPLSLLQNAIKYSVVGDIDIDLLETNDTLTVKIKSIGPIIKDDEIRNIFKRGYRGEEAKKHHVEGMGAGLYISNEVAKAHHFIISVESIDKRVIKNQLQMAENIFSFSIKSELK